MKILILSRDYPPYAWGGMGGVVENIIKLSKKFDLDLTIIANHPKLGILRETGDRLIIYRVPTIGSTFLTKLPSFSYYASKLVSKIQDNYDLIYSNSSPIFCKIKRPFIVHFQGTRYGEYLACKEIRKFLYALLNCIYIPFDKILLKKANGVIVLSENMINEINAMGGTSKKITVIPNGVDTEFFKPLKPKDFSSLEKKILFVGRLDARKGIDILFYSFKEVLKKIKAKLTIVGEGREKNKLLNLANFLSIPVEFLGRIQHESLLEVYNEADLFVLPSFYEGVPLVALEAMACGVPTIISSGCPNLGVPRFEKGNIGSLVEAILDILPHEGKLKELSQQCIKISANYDWQKIVPRIIGFIKEIKEGQNK
ncbi:MAG: glycosyltransferase family 4 protein [Candidatus Omnitrophota bacterium]